MSRNKYPEETVQKILDAALHLFLEKGYEQTTILDIVENMGGMTRGAFYHHFKSKEEVLDALGDKLFFDNNPFEKAMQQTKLTGLEKLKYMLASTTENTDSRKIQVMSVQALQSPAFLKKLIDDNRDMVAPIYQEIIEEGVRDGSIKTEHSKLLSQLLTLLTNFWTLPTIFPSTMEESIEKLLFIKEIMMKAYILKQKGLLFISIMFGTFFSVGMALIALILKDVIDIAISRNMDRFVSVVLQTSVYLVILGMCYGLYSTFSKKFICKLSMMLRGDIFRGIFKKNISDFKSVNSADYLSALTNDVKNVAENYITSLLLCLQNITVFITSFVVMVYLSPLVMLCLFAAMLLLIAVPSLFQKRIQIRQDSFSKRQSGFTVAVKDFLSGFEVIRSYRMNPYIGKAFDGENDAIYTSKYAIVGKNGCGKTTLINLLNGCYAGFGGEILYDGVDMRRLDIEKLNEMSSVIHQNVYMFDESIKDNICLHKQITQTDLERALNMSGVEMFLGEEKSLDTPVGENGNSLSGGQRQRVAVARALVQKKPILILDEGTSAVDMKTAYDIENQLLKLKDLTVITITHSLNPTLLKDYDQVIFMENGRIIEADTFENLLREKGTFYDFYNLKKPWLSKYFRSINSN